MAVAVKAEKKFTSLVPPKEPKGKGGLAMPEPAEFVPRGPMLYIGGVEVPDLNGKTLGAEFTATVKCKLVEMGMRESEKRGRRHNYEIEVVGINLE